MPTVALSPISDAQFFDNNGDPLNGGKLFYYVGGSFTVQKTTYSTSAGTTPNPNPIVLNSSGRPTASAFLVVGEPYNIRLTLADGTTVLNSWASVTVGLGGGGGGTPGGPDKSIQYNNTGTLAGTSTFAFDSTTTTVTFSGAPATITNPLGDLRLIPNTATGYVVVGNTGSNGLLEGTAGANLTIRSDQQLNFISNNSNILFDIPTGEKLSISGPSATQYATGLSDNDLVNKYYVDNNGGGGGGAVSQIVAGSGIGVSPAGGTGTVTVTNTGVTSILAGTGISVSTSTGAVTINATGGGGGGISGPGSTTDRAIATWNGTTGTALYNNAKIGINSSGEITVDDYVIGTGAYTGSPLQNIKIGAGGLAINAGGQQNIAIGVAGPLAANTTGNYNVAIGSAALNDNLIGNGSVAIGYQAMAQAASGGSYNTALGYQAGYQIYGTGNTILGPVWGTYGMTNTVLIAAGFNTQRLQINENGAWNFRNPYASEADDFGATGTVVVSQGSATHPEWKSALSKQLSYTELGDPIYFAPLNNVEGKVIKKSGGTIEANTGTCTADDFFMVYNTSNSTNMAINQGTGFTLRQAGTTNTGNRTLAPYGFARVWFVSSTEAVISGDGLT